MTNRRTVLKGMLATTGAMLSPSFIPQTFANVTASQEAAKPKRVIFFLQNHAFHGSQCTPDKIKDGAKLSKFTLPKFISPLEPYKDRLTIINGLHARHVAPSHSAYYGALGGYRKTKGSPQAATIDSVLAGLLPKGPIPHLCIGMETLTQMRNRPVFHALTASAPGQTVPMLCDPTMLYQTIFGGAIKDKKARMSFQRVTEMMARIEKQAKAKQGRLSGSEHHKYSTYVSGCQELTQMRKKLSGMADHLAKFVPEYNEQFTNPEFETDWHKAIMDVGIAALQAGVTNVLTVAAGCGQVGGSYEGLGVSKAGHSLGHSKPSEKFWIDIHQHNMKMLVKLMKSLEAVPEGNGTMMDNTLIVYTSNNGDYQHSVGGNWPFMMLGNFGQKMTTGSYFDFSKTKRPINAFYATLLSAAGQNVKHFNMSQVIAQKNDPTTGPIKELLR